jgi:hypothetical protein
MPAFHFNGYSGYSLVTFPKWEKNLSHKHEKNHFLHMKKLTQGDFCSMLLISLLYIIFWFLNQKCIWLLKMLQKYVFWNFHSSFSEYSLAYNWLICAVFVKFSFFFFFFAVLEFKLRAYTLSHFTSPFLWWAFSR